MTNQEKIREGIQELIFASWDKPVKSADLAWDILSYLHSQGVVYKIEEKLPSIFNVFEEVISAYEYRQKLVDYGKFESLLGE
uniref:Uncharacterized protein n=1 Tax=viral metagenome TaxID=1070528 RepID=A0A6M3J588_9ZZZZ